MARWPLRRGEQWPPWPPCADAFVFIQEALSTTHARHTLLVHSPEFHIATVKLRKTAPSSKIRLLSPAVLSSCTCLPQYGEGTEATMHS